MRRVTARLQSDGGGCSLLLLLLLLVDDSGRYDGRLMVTGFLISELVSLRLLRVDTISLELIKFSVLILGLSVVSVWK